ncbi:MAG: hypothetical protein R2941_03050 [Desulfobacterales bacterium]
MVKAYVILAKGHNHSELALELFQHSIKERWPNSKFRKLLNLCGSTAQNHQRQDQGRIELRESEEKKKKRPFAPMVFLPSSSRDRFPGKNNRIPSIPLETEQIALCKKSVSRCGICH